MSGALQPDHLLSESSNPMNRQFLRSFDNDEDQTKDSETDGHIPDSESASHQSIINSGLFPQALQLLQFQNLKQNTAIIELLEAICYKNPDFAQALIHWNILNLFQPILHTLLHKCQITGSTQHRLIQIQLGKNTSLTVSIVNFMSTLADNCSQSELAPVYFQFLSPFLLADDLYVAARVFMTFRALTYDNEELTSAYSNIEIGGIVDNDQTTNQPFLAHLPLFLERSIENFIETLLVGSYLGCLISWRHVNNYEIEPTIRIITESEFHVIDRLEMKLEEEYQMLHVILQETGRMFALNDDAVDTLLGFGVAQILGRLLYFLDDCLSFRFNPQRASRESVERFLSTFTSEKHSSAWNPLLRLLQAEFDGSSFGHYNPPPIHKEEEFIEQCRLSPTTFSFKVFTQFSIYSDQLIKQCVFILSNISGGTTQQIKTTLSTLFPNADNSTELAIEVLENVYQSAPISRLEILHFFRNISCEGPELAGILVEGNLFSILWWPYALLNKNSHVRHRILIEITLALLKKTDSPEIVDRTLEQFLEAKLLPLVRDLKRSREDSLKRRAIELTDLITRLRGDDFIDSEM
ncbi:hypothetical protein BLNAU_7773 [Blattamonas nauphoetae]|uniref:Uncharacterized protein n=1 Tax=Blattamonas nauphoetae TaxID=2049346 RepID=A0ABQ9Y0C2_9EUKA|nr:hypothetical protein BLNAU_7773 [Blattamonas nauphoetae]